MLLYTNTLNILVFIPHIYRVYTSDYVVQNYSFI